MNTRLADQLRLDLGTRIIGRDIHAYDLVISTNDVICELSDRGAEEGTVVFAEEQTSGRGRLGRSWWSPRGKGIWMSVLLRPPLRKGAVPMTTILGALAAADAIRSVTGLDALIRWPNDVVLEDRKVGGVLVEARTGPRGRELVLGIGIDVATRAGEFPPDLAPLATSLAEATGEDIDRTELARSLLRELDRWYQVELDGDIDAVNRRWRTLSATLGRHVVLEEDSHRYEGTVVDLDVTLGLALRTHRGAIRHFRGEYVTVIRHD